MNVCSERHGEVHYEGPYCPACALRDVIDYLEIDMQNLEEDLEAFWYSLENIRAQVKNTHSLLYDRSCGNVEALERRVRKLNAMLHSIRKPFNKEVL